MNPKSGTQTTELYLSIAGMIALTLITIALIATNQIAELGSTITAVSVGFAGITGTYSLGRAYVKGKASQTADIEPAE